MTPATARRASRLVFGNEADRKECSVALCHAPVSHKVSEIAWPDAVEMTAPDGTVVGRAVLLPDREFTGEVCCGHFCMIMGETAEPWCLSGHRRGAV